MMTSQRSGRVKRASDLLRLSLRASAAAVIFSAMNGAADAQNVPAGVNQGPNSEAIIVTARKRSESLLNVPISITAVSGAQLRALGAKNLEDYSGKVPGLALFTRGPTGTRGQGITLGIRGVSGGLSDPPVGFYLNDTPLPSINLKLYDIDTIEVLKGPQGTLYGARALGGLIKVSTRRPDLNSVSGMAEIEPSYTSHGGTNFSGNAAVNIPLVADKIALRASGYTVYESGYIDLLPGATAAGVPLPPPNPNPPGLIRHPDDELTRGARASLLFKASSDFRIIFDYIYQHTHQNDRSEWDVPLSNALGRPFVMGSFVSQPSSTNFNDGSVTANLNLGTVGSLTSSTSYVDYKSLDVEDLTYVAAAVLKSVGIPTVVPVTLNTPVVSKVFTQEVRLSSSNSSWFNYTAGLFYQNSKRNLSFLSQSAQFGNLINTKFGIPLVTNGLIIQSSDTTRVKELGAFGELYLTPIQSVSITLGGRYYDTRFTDVGTRSGFFGTAPTNLKSHDHGVNPKFTVSWKPVDKLNLYASASKGFRRGGANNVSAIPPNCGTDLAALGLSSAPASYKSDSLWQYEVGAKGAPSRALSFEAAAFRTDWKDRQLLVTLPHCGFNFGGNVGKARIDGAELAMHVRPNAWFSIDGTASYLDGRVLEDTPQAGLKKGDRLPLAPRWTYSLGAEAEQPLSAKARAFVRADYQYRSSMVDGLNRVTLPAFGSVNLRGGVRFDRMAIVLFVENLTNSRGQLSAEGSGFLTSVSPALRVHSLRPRTVGTTLSFDWK